MASGTHSDQRIGRTLAQSHPHWPAQPQPAEGAPNVVIVLMDDLGYSDFGCFGAEIRTPAIDALAREGAAFTNYTTVPMCTPARAALMTGMNPHSVGCGWLTHSDPGYPGYRSGEMNVDVPTLPQLLQSAGYGTYGVGKWHNTAVHKVNPAGTRDTWPLQRGFDRFHGFMAGEVNFFSPGHLVDGNDFVEVDEYPAGYYCTDAWTDKSLQYLKAHHAASPSKPFFLYLAHNAPHVPLQARDEAIASYRGMYNEGWEAVRAARFERQKRSGVAEANWRLSPQGQNIPHWDTLDAGRRALFARYMEIYAAMIESVDQNLARLVAWLKEAGQFNNTLFLITSDNGATSIGGPEGAANVLDRRVAQASGAELALQLLRDGKLGGPQSYSAYPAGWGNVCNAPFRMYKRSPMNGGTRVPMVVHWPRGMRAAGELRKNWVHVTDILPTVLDCAGIAHPAKLHGHSFASMLGDAGFHTARDHQHFELEGNRGYIAGDWKIVSHQPPAQPMDLDSWMLFNLHDDPTECNDMAEAHPDVLARMIRAFESDAHANNVYPLDNRDHRRMLAVPPYLEQAIRTPRVLYPGGGSLPADLVSPLIADRCWRVVCRFNWREGDEGVLVAIGNSFAGVSLYASGARLHVCFAAGGKTRTASLPLAAGDQEAVLDHQALGVRKGLGTLSLGKHTVDLDMSPTLMRLAGDGMDVGADRRLSVTVYPIPGAYPYSGAIRDVRLEPGAQAPDSIANLPELAAQQAIQN